MNLLRKRRAARRTWIAALVMPALLLRALVPMGFMLMVGADGNLSLEFCSGFAAPVDAHAQHPAHHHEHTDEQGAGSQKSQSHTPCLFAVSAAPPLARAPMLAIVAPQFPTAHARIAVATPFAPSILRAQSPRAPPPTQA